MTNLNEPQFRQLLDAYLNGTATPAEKKLLDDFFESFPAARAQFTGNDEEVKQLLWQKISARTAPVAVPKRSGMLWYAAAASLALLVASSYWLFTNNTPAPSPLRMAREQQAETVRGQKLKIELVDGTQVILNASSKLTFPDQFTGGTREVYLEGEAFFDVAHNAAQPFIVHSSKANTTVLGTSFNVRALAGTNTEITLVEGKVDVAAVGSPSVAHTILAPNEQAIVGAADGIVKRQVAVAEYVDWKDNVIHFNNVSLKDAALRLQEWYNVDIAFENADMQRCMVTATYRKESLKNILDSFSHLFKLDYEQNGRHVTLRGKGC